MHRAQTGNGIVHVPVERVFGIGWQVRARGGSDVWTSKFIREKVRVVRLPHGREHDTPDSCFTK